MSLPASGEIRVQQDPAHAMPDPMNLRSLALVLDVSDRCGKIGPEIVIDVPARAALPLPPRRALVAAPPAEIQSPNFVTMRRQVPRERIFWSQVEAQVICRKPMNEQHRMPPLGSSDIFQQMNRPAVSSDNLVTLGKDFDSQRRDGRWATSCGHIILSANFSRHFT